MSWLTRLLGGGEMARAETSAPGPAEMHEGFEIRPEPMKAEGGWRIAATIEKSVGGETRTHRLVRADVLADRDAATAASVAKARQVIDQQGESIFDEGPRRG